MNVRAARRNLRLLIACLSLAISSRLPVRAADKSSGDVKNTLENILAIAYSAKTEASGSLSDFQNQLKEIQNPGAEGYMGEQDEEALRAVSQPLENKDELLMGKAGMAGVNLPKLEEKDLMSIRLSYRPAQRERELKRIAAKIHKPKKKSKKFIPSPKQQSSDFLGDAREYLGDVKTAQRIVADTIRHLETLPVNNISAQDTLAKLRMRSRQLEQDIQDLNREIQLFEISIKTQ